jgi:hypothetical protein
MKGSKRQVKWGAVAAHVGDGRSVKSCWSQMENFKRLNPDIDWTDKTQWEDKDWDEFVWPGPWLLQREVEPYANVRDNKRRRKTIDYVIATTSVLDYPDLSYEENRKLQEEYDWENHVVE